MLSSSKYNINDNLIQLNNIRIKKNNGILTKHLDTQIYLKNNVNIKSVYSNSKLIDIKGKLKITNNLVITNNFNVGYLTVNNYESDILKNSGYVNVDNLFKSKILESNISKISYLEVPKNPPLLNKIISNPITTTTQQTTTTSASNSITTNYQIWRIKHDTVNNKLIIVISYTPLSPPTTFNRSFNGHVSGSNNTDQFFLLDSNSYPNQTTQNTFNFSDYSDLILLLIIVYMIIHNLALLMYINLKKLSH